MLTNTIRVTISYDVLDDFAEPLKRGSHMTLMAPFVTEAELLDDYRSDFKRTDWEVVSW